MRTEGDYVRRRCRETEKEGPFGAVNSCMNTRTEEKRGGGGWKILPR